MRPVWLAGDLIQAVQEAAEIGIEQQPVGDGAGGNRAPDLVVMPQPASLCDVTALGAVDRVQMPHSLAVLRVLAVGDEHLVFPDYWGCDHFISCLRPHRVLGV